MSSAEAIVWCASWTASPVFVPSTGGGGTGIASALFSTSIRGLWGCAEELSVAPVNRKKMVQWLETFSGALNDTADVPVYKRGDGRCM